MKNEHFLFRGIWLIVLSLFVVFAGHNGSAYGDDNTRTYLYRDGSVSSGAAAANRKQALKQSLAWREKANKYLTKGNYTEAAIAATRALGYDRGSTENYMIRAKAFAGMGSYAKASADWQQVILMNPESGEGYNGMGELAEQVGNMTEAKKYYEKSCELNETTACNHLERIRLSMADNPEEQLRNANTPEDLELFINEHNPDELAFVAVQQLAKPYINVRDWRNAAAVYQKYQSDFPGMETRFARIITILLAPEEGLSVINLGTGVNTEKGEYNPVISADGHTLYYARDLGEKCCGEDIFISEMRNDQWNKGTSLGSPINTPSHEVPLSISADGTTIALFGNYPESFGRGDIFYADKTANCWTGLKHYPAPINSEYFDGNAMYVSDGKSILLVSERPGGIGEFHKKDELFHGSYGGNTDIYVYAQNENGEYELINLGPTINTPYSEYSPYLHPDGKTLYFSSDGHDGLGGLDVFKATRLNDASWTEWSSPVNLGKEINGPNNDWGYQISTDGEVAYFSASDRLEGFGANDVFAVQLPGIAKPHAVTAISGMVTDPDGNAVEVKIRWNDINLGKGVGEARSDPQTGRYFIALPAGRLYSYYAEKEGYMSSSEEVDLTDKVSYAEYQVDIVMYPIDKIRDGEMAMRINNIFFDFDKWTLKPVSGLELDRWVSLMKAQPDMRAEIRGHADSTGTDAYNQSLSEKRAASVMRYLIDHGIDKARLTAVGFGESRPVASNDTAEGQKLNRRVEIKFSSMATTGAVPLETSMEPSPPAMVPATEGAETVPAIEPAPEGDSSVVPNMEEASPAVEQDIAPAVPEESGETVNEGPESLPAKN